MCLAGCECGAPEPEIRPEEALPGGETSVAATEGGLEPVANLPPEARSHFFAGRALAKQPWVRAPTTTDARDGLGPLYNARSCTACHPSAGRGRVPQKDGESVLGGALVRLSVPGTNQTEGVVPEPHYGAQLQTKSVALSSLLGRSSKRRGEVKPEAKLTLRWQETTFRYPDGREVTLRRPEPQLEELAYGPLAADTMMSLRNAPSLRGMGLIEAIAEEDIAAWADPDDHDGDGISGRANHVWDRTAQQRVLGRFGLKANQPTLHQQVAAAFAGDIGITNTVHADQPCTATQEACMASPSGAGANGVEIEAELLALVVGFVRHLGVPKRPDATDSQVVRGRAAFRRQGCAKCHRPGYSTVSTMAHLDGQEIWPYSDLLLHDMGDGLSDGRPDHEASAREWRTAPLWASMPPRGTESSRYLLHDGRAATLEEAILWHGGEATAARDAFANASAAERADVIRFLESL